MNFKQVEVLLEDQKPINIIDAVIIATEYVNEPKQPANKLVRFNRVREYYINNIMNGINVSDEIIDISLLSEYVIDLSIKYKGIIGTIVCKIVDVDVYREKLLGVNNQNLGNQELCKLVTSLVIDQINKNKHSATKTVIKSTKESSDELVDRLFEELIPTDLSDIESVLKYVKIITPNDGNKCSLLYYIDLLMRVRCYHSTHTTVSFDKSIYNKYLQLIDQFNFKKNTYELQDVIDTVITYIDKSFSIDHLPNVIITLSINDFIDHDKLAVTDVNYGNALYTINKFKYLDINFIREVKIMSKGEKPNGNNYVYTNSTNVKVSNLIYQIMYNSAVVSYSVVGENLSASFLLRGVVRNIFFTKNEFPVLIDMFKIHVPAFVNSLELFIGASFNTMSDVDKDNSKIDIPMLKLLQSLALDKMIDDVDYNNYSNGLDSLIETGLIDDVYNDIIDKLIEKIKSN